MQGVFFRSFVAGRAVALGLVGYVCNLPDSTVEVWAEGERERLEKLISYLEEGPPGARVEEVATSWSEYTGDYPDFRIRY